MALAISAVSLIGIAALVPLGVQSQKISNDLSVCSLIVRELVSEARQADFDKLLSSPVTTYRYFDNEGFETARSAQVYTAEMVLTPRVDVAGPSNSRVNLNDFARLRIRVAVNQLGRLGNDAAVFMDQNRIVHTSAAYIGRKESIVK